MRQILHILKKDLKHHLPEALISILFLCVYGTNVVRAAGQEKHYVGRLVTYSSGFFWRTLGGPDIFIPLMIGFWIFMILRVVQGEPLVGDRQWWVTKPYRWWNLLLAKLAFLCLVISLPLFVVQMVTVSSAGFPAARAIPGILYMQLGLWITLFLASITVACISRSLGQALLVIAAALILLIFASQAGERIPDIIMSGAVPGLDTAVPVIMLGAAIAAILLQFARRRTLVSRLLLVGAAAFICLTYAVVPYAWFADRTYRVPAANDMPVLARLQPAAEPLKKTRDWFDSAPEISLDMPVTVSGVKPGHMVMIDAARFVARSGDGSLWDSHWGRAWGRIWQEDTEARLQFQMPREAVDRLKGKKLDVQVELAVTEYAGGPERDVVLPEGKFEDADFGQCELTRRGVEGMACTRLFGPPGLMLSYDFRQSGCSALPHTEEEQTARPFHEFLGLPHSTPPVGLNPVLEYSVDLSYQKANPVSGLGFVGAQLCPGAKLALMKPRVSRLARVEMHEDNIDLRQFLAPEFLEDPPRAPGVH